MIRKLNSSGDNFPAQIEALMQKAAVWDQKTLQTVRTILDKVRDEGDSALLEYTALHDKHSKDTVGDLEVSAKQARLALQKLPHKQRRALQTAAQRIEEYHRHQRESMEADWHYRDEEGLILGRIQRPLQKVGIYAPGGQAVYPSSVLMTAIPARVAGVQQIVLSTPANNGKIEACILAAAAIAGVDRIFMIGGAQAVAALAFGTETVPAVDKIVGPGNRYVAAAKQMLYGQVGVDMLAGPSEILIIADGESEVDWVVLDMFAQAEHDVDARALLLSPSAGFLRRVEKRIVELLPKMKRYQIIRESLQRHGALIKVQNLKEAAALSNQIAPEHLSLAVKDPQQMLPQLYNAGAVFLGPHVAEALGDYCAGPSHVLPTARTARFGSPLGVEDFRHSFSLIGSAGQYSERLVETAATLARIEGLEAHAHAAECRQTDPQKAR